MKAVDQLILLQNFLRIGISRHNVIGASLGDVGELLPGDLIAGERLRLEPVAAGIDVGSGIEAAVETADVEKGSILGIHEAGGPVIVDVLGEFREEDIVSGGSEVGNVPAEPEDYEE